MTRSMKIMLISLSILFGLVSAYKIFTTIMIGRFITKFQNPTITVSAQKATYQEWEQRLTATGSLRAIHGVNVTTELAGMVQTVYFTPGATVKKGDKLAQLNADVEIGTLDALKAQAALAKITYERDKAQFAVKAISKQQLDTDIQNLKNLEAQVEAQKGTVAKKTIVAPFDGRLGVNNINPGLYLNVGDRVTTIQTVDPIWADFYLPQQTLAQLHVGLPVHIKSDAFPNKLFEGKITTIEPLVDVSTRNVLVEATIANKDQTLTPGMFVNVVVEVGNPQKYITLPQTAITFNPYGNLVYLITPNGQDENGKPKLFANQSFVVTGDMRGEQIAVLSGIRENQTVVTSGQLKLKNGSRVRIDNSVQPPNSPHPDAPNER